MAYANTVAIFGGKVSDYRPHLSANVRLLRPGVKKRMIPYNQDWVGGSEPSKGEPFSYGRTVYDSVSTRVVEMNPEVVIIDGSVGGRNLRSAIKSIRAANHRAAILYMGDLPELTGKLAFRAESFDASHGLEGLDLVVSKLCGEVR